MTTTMDMATVMHNENFNDQLAAQLQEMENNPVVSKLLEAAQTVEDMYNIAKGYFEITFEKFQTMYEEATNYFKQDKVELADDTMEAVVGGVPKWLKKLGKIALATVIVVGVVAACAATAGAAGAAVGALGGYVVGTFGATAASVAAGVTVGASVAGMAAGGAATAATAAAIGAGATMGWKLAH